MAFKSKSKVFSRYHVLEAMGYYASNPANANAVDDDGNSIYKGPIEYPKMLFHPEGKIRVVNVGTMEKMPDGTFKEHGRIEEIEWQSVENAEQEAELRAQGWHDSPVKAIRAAPTTSKIPAPKLTQTEVMEQMAKRIAELEAEKAASAAPQPKAPHTPGSSRSAA